MHRSGFSTGWAGRGSWLLSALVVPALLLGACGSDGPADPNDDSDLEIVDSVSVQLAVDSGEVGLVIDAREYLRRGYKPTEVEVALPGHGAHDQTLPVDPVTGLAVMRLKIEDLTSAERAAFGSGVEIQFSILDEAHVSLGQHSEASQVLDDSNLPLSLPATLPYILRPLALREEVPYLLQPEGQAGVMSSFASDAYKPDLFLPDNPVQQFFFTPKAGSADPDTYMVEHIAGYPDGTIWTIGTDGWLHLRSGTLPEPPGGPDGFVLEQDDDGWLRIRVEGTNDYLVVSDEAGGIMEASATESTRFRLISDDINWTVVDRGTVYHDPIVPPAQLDFAYEATIRNCSEATLTETIGRSESRATSSTVTSTESLQLFSSEQLSVGMTIGAEVGGGVPGIGEVSGSVEATTSYTFTTSQTASTENAISETSEQSTEVSRTRELALPPHTAVEVYDAVRTIENVRLPFSQVLRISGTYKDGGAALTGPEIMSQMLFNFVTGVPKEIGTTFVDVSLRGHMAIDQLLEAQTDANDIPGACD